MGSRNEYETKWGLGIDAGDEQQKGSHNLKCLEEGMG